MAGTDEVKAAVAQVVEVLGKLKAADADAWGSVEVRAGKPATGEEIAAMEARIERELPAAYRAFLELHNGYADLHVTGPLLSTAEMESGESAEHIEELAEILEGEGHEGVIVGCSFDSDDFVYLDAERGVVTFNEFDEVEYEDFAAYLRGRAEIFGSLV